MTTNPGVFKIGNKIYTANNIKKKLDRMKINYDDVIILEEIVSGDNVDNQLSNLESKYITLKQKKDFTDDDFKFPNKYYFYQPIKDTYLVSVFYYPIDCDYFDIPEGETLKTMIESGKIYMSNNEDMIKKIMEIWKKHYKKMQID